jgi:hypothetical protein
VQFGDSSNPRLNSEGVELLRSSDDEVTVPQTAPVSLLGVIGYAELKFLSKKMRINRRLFVITVIFSF